MAPNPSCSLAPRRTRGRAILIVAGSLLTLLACSGDPPEAADPTNPPETRDSAEASGAPAEAPSLTDPADTAGWSIGVTSAPSSATVPPLPVLTALRTGTHEDHERVTFVVGGDSVGERATEAPDGRPGYRVEYVDRPLVECGSGNRIYPVGDGWLEVRLEPAAAHTEKGRPTLGPSEVEVAGPLLRRIYRTCDFEGIVIHVLALESPNEYRVFTLGDPLRIVVDVRR